MGTEAVARPCVGNSLDVATAALDSLEAVDVEL